MIGKPGPPWLCGAGTDGDSQEEGTTNDSGETCSLEASILSLLERHEAPMSAMEIAHHLQDEDRTKVKSLLEGPLNDLVESEGVTPARWCLKRDRKESAASEEDVEALGFWDRLVLEVLERSPYRLTAREIAETITQETEMETDGTAVEALLSGSLRDRVMRHGDAPIKWSARQQPAEGDSR